MKKFMNYIDINLNIFKYRESQSFGFSRNGTMDLSCQRLYKLNTNGKKKEKMTMGPSQHCFAKQLEAIQKENKVLDRFIRRYS